MAVLAVPLPAALIKDFNPPSISLLYSNGNAVANSTLSIEEPPTG